MRTAVLFFCFMAFFVQISNSQEPDSLIGKRDKSIGYERFRMNKEIILTGSDDAQMISTIEDSANLAKDLNADPDLLATLEKLLSGNPSAEVKDKALLTKARVVFPLRRQGSRVCAV